MKPLFIIAQVLVLFFCQQQFCQAQTKGDPPQPVLKKVNVTHGPVIGAVTDHSAKVFLRTSSEVEVHFLLYNPDNSLFINITTKTLPEKDTSVMIQLDNLSADYTYHYEVFVNGSKQRQGSIHTFASTANHNPFSFAFGSCIEQNRGDSIFVELQKQQPAFFLHLGDWTYPDHENYPQDIIGGTNQFYSLDYSKVQEAYRVRYSMPNMNKFMENTPMDFIHDDDDFVFDGNSRTSQSGTYFKGKKTILFEKPLPPGARYNAIKEYMECFPHYPIEHDTANGVYHKFRYGNVEVFFLDSRANRSAENEAFKVKGGKIYFAPDSTHSILGKEQMAWLLDGLAKSTADWKFVVSGTNFNMGYRRVIDLALFVQNKKLQPGVTGAVLASGMAATWAGFPHDQAKLINYCADNHIKNVVMLSGDVHSSAIDDGKNAGLPELVGANLGVPNSKVPYILHNKVGLDIWDIGAQGVHNDNFNYCFGKVDIFGRDSIKLNVVDQYGTVVTSCILKDGIVASHVNLADMAGTTKFTRHRKRHDLFHLVGKMFRKNKDK